MSRTCLVSALQDVLAECHDLALFVSSTLYSLSVTTWLSFCLQAVLAECHVHDLALFLSPVCTHQVSRPCIVSALQAVLAVSRPCFVSALRLYSLSVTTLLCYRSMSRARPCFVSALRLYSLSVTCTTLLCLCPQAVQQLRGLCGRRSGGLQQHRVAAARAQRYCRFPAGGGGVLTSVELYWTTRDDDGGGVDVDDGGGDDDGDGGGVMMGKWWL